METLVGELHFELEKSKLYSFKLNIELSNINFSNFNFQLKIKMGSVSLRYRFVVGLKKWFASIFSWFASAVYWVESAHSCSVTFFECHYDTNDYWGTGCGYLKKIIFASFKNGNICYQMIEFNFFSNFVQTYCSEVCFFGKSTAFRYFPRKFWFFQFWIFFMGAYFFGQLDISPRVLRYFQFSFFGGSLIFRPINCIKTFFPENFDFPNFHFLVGVCSYNLL